MTAQAVPGVEVHEELTPYELHILFRVAQGDKYQQIAHLRGITAKGLSCSVRRILRKTGAQNMAHAVYLATRNGLIGDWPDCGERRAYLRHLRRKETPCPRCRNGNAQHGRAQRAGALTGTQGFQPKERVA